MGPETGEPSGAVQDDAQEQGGQSVPAVEQGTNLAATSEAQPAVQEQPAEQGPEIADEERQRREVQSEVDKRLHQERRAAVAEYQQQQKARETVEQERARVREMDDEDYGAYMREQQKLEAQQAVTAARARATMVEQLRNDALNIVTNAQKRAELAARAQAGEFESYGQFVAAANEIEHGAQNQRRLTRETSAAREAGRNEAVAEQANAVTPQLGTGLPTSSMDTQKMSSRQLIAAGYAEEIARKRAS